MARTLTAIAALCLAVGVLAAVPAAAVIPGGFSDVVILGTNSVALDHDVDVTSGDVVANDASAGPTLEAGYELFVDNKSTVAGNLSGDSVGIDHQAAIGGDVSYNELDNDGTIGGSEITPLALPVFGFLPPFETGPSDGPDVSVAHHQTQSLAAGTYGDVSIDHHATLVLTGGVYDLRSLSAEQNVTIVFEAPSVVHVAGRVAVGQNAVFGPADGSGVGADQIVVYVAGINGTDGALDSSPNAAQIGDQSTVQANFYVPNGTFYLDHHGNAAGAFIARDVFIAHHTQVALSTFFFNRPPVAGDDSMTVLEGGSTSVLDSGETSLLANDTDPDGDNLSVTTTPVTPPTHGALVLNADGTFTYTHDGSETTSDAFEYQVCDDGTSPGPLCDVGAVVITVIPVNDPPNAQDDSATTDEDTPVVIDVLANDSDVDGNLVPSSVSVVTGPSNGGTSVNAGTGAVTYTPAANFNGSDSFQYEVCDDGTPLPSACSTATVTVTVNPVNDPPNAQDDSATTDEDTPVVIDVLANDSDIDGNLVPSSVSVVSGPSNGGTSVDAGTGAVTYTPDANFNGSDSFQYEVCDDGTPLPSACSTATVTVTVNPVNDPPTANPQTVTVVPGGPPVTITLTGSDPEGDTLTFSIVSSPAHGTLSGLISTGPSSATIEYTPDLSFDSDGTDDFEFGVDDGNGGSDSAVVTLVASDVNDPPTARSDSAFVEPGGTVTTLAGGATSVLANDSDPEGDNLTVTTTPVSGPSHGVVTLNADGTFSYTNANDGATSDSFVYQVCDDGTPVACSTATVFISVRALSVTVTVTKSGPGAADSLVFSTPAGIDCGVTCSAVFSTSTGIALTADAADGFAFDFWTGDADCADGFLTPTADVSCEAVFKEAPPPPVGDADVTISKAGTGSGVVTSDPAGIDCGSTCTATFPAFSHVTLNATPDPGSEFAFWSGDPDCSDGVLGIDANKSCTANFNLLPTNTFTLTVTKAGNGDGGVTSSPGGIFCGDTCVADFEDGTVVTLFVRPDSSSTFLGWSGDCSGTSFITTVTMDAAKICTANFQ